MPVQRNLARCLCAMLLVAGSTNLFAQAPKSFSFSHSLSTARVRPTVLQAFARAQPETVRALAAMVEFQPDNDPLTTGTGLFDTANTQQHIIDPPPHDRSYFQNHLLFLQNYWKSVTNGTLIVVSDLVDTIVRLAQPMQAYSPPPGSVNNFELATLVREVWQRVDSLPSPHRPDFLSYSAFCIFHAGSGRDVDLTSIFGYDPTPYDLPSVYLDSTGLRRALGPAFRGVPVLDSTFFVTNSMIVPETENRPISSFGGDILLELGINGLLAASTGSYLGLPDLFDTQSGNSGIGRFGLMDGQSIFSWNGVFPPEPSAWEKYYLEKTRGLGFLDVVEAPPGRPADTVSAVSLRSAGKDTILKVPINPREYFLLENRNRDARRDSVIVFRAFNGFTERRAFLRDTVGFADRGLGNYDLDSLYGVVVDVDEFDFSLPGGVTADGEFFDGGMLIWHIDENTINAGISANTVNANSGRRGVDLEEADGSQDIGQSYGFLDPGSGSEAGTALDFWYKHTTAVDSLRRPVYTNEFSLRSYPNSQTNDGANSHIRIADFSPRDSRMRVVVDVGDNHVKPMPGYPVFVGKSANNSPQFSRAVFVSVGDSIFAWKPDTAISATANGNGLFAPRGGGFPAAIVPASVETTYVVGVQDSTVFIWTAFDGNSDGIFDSVTADSVKVGASITTPPVIREYAGGASVVTEAIVGDTAGRIHIVGISPRTVADSLIGSTAVRSLALLPGGTSAKSAWVAATTNVLRVEGGSSTSLPHASKSWEVVAAQDRVVAADMNGASLFMYTSGLQLVRRYTAAASQHSSLAVGDINSDGKKDIVFAASNKLYAINQTGAVLDYFPVTLPGEFCGAPIIVRMTADRSRAEIVMSTRNGLVAAYDSKGKMLDGFPLAVSGPISSSPLIFEIPTTSLSLPTQAVLAVADDNGFLSAWGLDPLRIRLDAPWSSFRGNTKHSGSDTTSGGLVIVPSEFFPSARAYNWPNPVYDGKTSIRYYVKEDASVRITIFDLAGERVDELTGPGAGGMDNEVEWNVQSIQSGVYFGRIEATAGEQKGVAIIKIAVVK